MAPSGCLASTSGWNLALDGFRKALSPAAEELMRLCMLPLLAPLLFCFLSCFDICLDWQVVQASTYFFVNPHEELAACFLTQLISHRSYAMHSCRKLGARVSLLRGHTPYWTNWSKECMVHCCDKSAHLKLHCSSRRQASRGLARGAMMEK